jgi:hypothetical protein
MMSPRDKPKNGFRTLPDHGDEQLAQAQVPFPKAVLPSSKRVRETIERQTDPIGLMGP